MVLGAAFILSQLDSVMLKAEWNAYHNKAWG